MADANAASCTSTGVSTSSSSRPNEAGGAAEVPGISCRNIIRLTARNIDTHPQMGAGSTVTKSRRVSVFFEEPGASKIICGGIVWAGRCWVTTVVMRLVAGLRVRGRGHGPAWRGRGVSPHLTGPHPTVGTQAPAQKQTS